MDKVFRQLYKAEFLPYILIAFSFPKTYNFALISIVVYSLYNFYKLIINKLAIHKIIESYFYLLVFSLIFFRSIHSLLLIITLLFSFYGLFKTNEKEKEKNYKTEVLIIVFFLIIFSNQLIFFPYLKTINTYLYLAFYPVLFVIIKMLKVEISVVKSLKVYLYSTLTSMFLLFSINLYSSKILLKTNTFFAEPLGLTHVYYGMFLGVASCFLLKIYLLNKKFINKKIDYITFLLFIATLMYIGARISVIAILFILSLTLFSKVKMQSYKKLGVLFFVLLGMLFASYMLIPRAQDDIKYVKKVYHSVKTNDKKDLIFNSWRNMYQRFLVTKYTLKEIKEHWFLGIGIHNVKETLNSKIKQDEYIYFNALNPHNQYLHFWLGLGILPLLYFIYMLCYFLKNHPNALLFLSFFIIIMLTESLFVRVKGVSLFFFFVLVFSFKIESLDG